MGDIFQKKTDIFFSFSSIPNVFGIAEVSLIEKFDEWGKDHNATLKKVLQVCR